MRASEALVVKGDKREMKGALVRVLALAALGLLVVACSQQPAAPAQSGSSPASEVAGARKVDFPTRAITLVVPGAAGGGGDILARQLGLASEPYFPQPIVVENRPGAGGSNAVNYMLSQPKDGHTVVHVSRSIATMNPYTADLPYDYRDFKGVIKVQDDPTMVTVRADAPWQTVDELVADLKANPGQIKFGGSVVGSADHLPAYIWSKEADFQLDWVVYSSGNEAGVALLGDHVQVIMGNPSDQKPNLDAGTVRFLATASPERFPDFQDVPTLAEKGWDVGDMRQWRGFIVHKDVPDEVVAVLHDGFKQAIDTPGFQEYQAGSGLVNGYLGPEEFDEFLMSESEANKQIFAELGLLKKQN